MRYLCNHCPFFSTIFLFNDAGLLIWASHWVQLERSREQPRASICRRWAPRRTGIPTRRVENKAPALSWRPLGICGELTELSERSRVRSISAPPGCKHLCNDTACLPSVSRAARRPSDVSVFRIIEHEFRVKEGKRHVFLFPLDRTYSDVCW